MKKKKVVLISGIVVTLMSFAWFISDISWEPAIGLVTGLIGIYIAIKYSDKNVGNSNTSLIKKNIEINSGNNTQYFNESDKQIGEENISINSGKDTIFVNK
ncbi:hypothetical protein [Lewinella sp.]|uniref:hypothetical protein n=1 Tax=Lewinella sp. TaxID=2004506 RepID=UPI003D6A1A37